MNYPNLTCKHIITQEDINGDTTLVHCTHPKNPCDSEGNCHEKDCPLASKNIITFEGMSHLAINICNTPEEAPNYNELPLVDQPTTVRIEKAIVVKAATVDQDSSIDLQMVDGFGNKYMTMISGKLLRSVAKVSEKQL